MEKEYVVDPAAKGLIDEPVPNPLVVNACLVLHGGMRARPDNLSIPSAPVVRRPGG